MSPEISLCPILIDSVAASAHLYLRVAYLGFTPEDDHEVVSSHKGVVYLDHSLL